MVERVLTTPLSLLLGCTMPLTYHLKFLFKISTRHIIPISYVIKYFYAARETTAVSKTYFFKGN